MAQFLVPPNGSIMTPCRQMLGSGTLVNGDGKVVRGVLVNNQPMSGDVTFTPQQMAEHRKNGWLVRVDGDEVKQLKETRKEIGPDGVVVNENIPGGENLDALRIRGDDKTNRPTDESRMVKLSGPGSSESGNRLREIAEQNSSPERTAVMVPQGIERLQRNLPLIDPVIAPPDTSAKSPWNLDPTVLQDQSLEKLNVLLLERDPAAEPFTDATEAALFLSQDFRPADAKQN